MKLAIEAVKYPSATTPRGRAFRFRRASSRSSARFLLSDFDSWSLLGFRCIPVVDHLRGNHGIEYESCHNAVENKRIVDFLKRREDSGGRAKEKIEHLPVTDQSSSINGYHV